MAASKRKPAKRATGALKAGLADIPSAWGMSIDRKFGDRPFVGALGPEPFNLPPRPNEFTSKTVHRFTIIPVTRFEIRHSRDADNNVRSHNFSLAALAMADGRKICECESRDEAEKIAEAMAKAAR